MDFGLEGCPLDSEHGEHAPIPAQPQNFVSAKPFLLQRVEAFEMANQNISDLDSIWERLGTFGKYNIVNYVLLLFPIYLAGMYGTGYVFEAPDLNYRIKPASEYEDNALNHRPIAADLTGQSV
ncbi:hypothetical protein EVAR_65689_1 [Eumeta japonica]|uniref:Uncharacterized protein n=1 Tax=Eumeta variegata TaxID=151549 RepID=A0A4C1Z859_EUMVA|nr:hypothetical protein EVAR_65689_1 [Eumeta japonica]